MLTELTDILGVYSDRPVSGMPAVNDEASDVRWVASGDLESLDIHPTQWRHAGRAACGATR